MKIVTVVAGPIETNAFIVADETTRDAMIVDAPPDSFRQIMDAVRDADLTVTMIVLTHAHFDHVIDAAALKRETGAPLAISTGALEHLRQGIAGGTVPYTVADIGPDLTLDEGDVVEVGALRFRVLLTPGHAPGQISLVDEGETVVFGGDTLFPNGYGRVDLPESSEDETRASIAKLLALPDRVTVFPGHGATTTIGAERGWMERVVERGLF